jgi:hypothetical protein
MDNTRYLYAQEQGTHIIIQSVSLELVTVIECVVADGSNLKLGFVFSGKNTLQEEYFEENRVL